MTIRGKTFAVRGQGWMDHEFSSAPLEPNIAGWDWLWIGLGVMLDIMKWSSWIKYRDENEYYPETMP